MVVIQERCEDCEELMFGGKCRNVHCIKRNRKGAVIWGGKGFGLAPPVYHAIATDTTVNEVESSLTISDVTLPQGACLIVAVGGHAATLPSVSATWKGQALSDFAPRVASTDLAQTVLGLANVSGGTGDIVASFGGNPVSATVIASYVTGADPDPLDDYNTLNADSGTVNTGCNIIVFNAPSIFLFYAGNLLPISEPVSSWATSTPVVLTQGQRDGTTGATPPGLDSTMSEGHAVGSSFEGDYFIEYGTFTNSEWCGSVVCLKAGGSKPGGLP
jgi:hypothetical protein